MRDVSNELIKRIEDYVLVQKVSLEAVLILVARDLQFYTDEIKEHLKKFIKYLMWLDDNDKDPKNAWEKYVSRVEWLENKAQHPDQNENRIKRLVRDLEAKEAQLKQRKANDARIESIYRKFWESQAVQEPTDVQLSFEEVVLSNGDTMITTLIEETLEQNPTQPNPSATDSQLSLILDEDVLEETQLESIINGDDSPPLPTLDVETLPLQPATLEIITQDVIAEAEAPKTLEIITSEFDDTELIPLNLEDVYADLSNNELLDQIGSRLDNTNSDLYHLNATDVENDADIHTSDYNSLLDPATYANLEDTSTAIQQSTNPVETNSMHNEELVVFHEDTNHEPSANNHSLLDDFSDDPILSTTEEMLDDFSFTNMQTASGVHESTTTVTKTTVPPAHSLPSTPIDEISQPNSLTQQAEGVVDDFMHYSPTEEPSLEDNSWLHKPETLQPDENENYLSINKYEEQPSTSFILDNDEQTLFVDDNTNDNNMDESMFEDSTMQTFADDQNPTLDALEFLNNLEEKYSTLLDFDPDMLSATADEAHSFQTRTTNTLDALDFVERMDIKYADLLNAQVDDFTDPEDSIEPHLATLDPEATNAK